MAKLTEKSKILALAHLHQGKTPSEVEELLEGVSYAQALRLKKELTKAIEDDKLCEIFDLEEAALEGLMETVHLELSDAAEALTGDLLPLDEAMSSIGDKIEHTKLLETEVAQAGITLAKKINSMANVANNPETIYSLADALAKLQTAFFKNNSVQIASFEAGSGFEDMLGK